MNKNDMRQAIKIVTSRLSNQTGKTGEERLMVAIFERALLDLLAPDVIRETRTASPSGKTFHRTVSNLEKKSAKTYLMGPMFNLMLVELETSWVRRVLKDSGLWTVITEPMEIPPKTTRHWQPL